MGDNKPGIYKLRGVVRNYDWGGSEFLSALLSADNQQKLPMAEYWLGAHDTDSSILITDGREIKLNEFIAGDKGNILGQTVEKKFGGLPFLLKILDVKNMLSIQVHPSKHTAELEFARENKEKVPLNARSRNYKDDNHKPELMVALSDFWLLHGFKPVGKLRTTLSAVPELKSLLEIFDTTGYDQLYKTAMEMPQQTVNEMLQPVLDRILPLYKNDRLKKTDENFWAARAALTFNQPNKIDRGIFSIYFFNLLLLKPGEGIFQDAGLPHAYLEGQNVEIMANSDNVLRGGLTKKHVDVKELMKNIKFEETRPEILHPLRKDGEELYQTPAPDFRLSSIHLKSGGSLSFQSVTAEILLVLDGDVTLASDQRQLELRKGEAAFIVYHRPVVLHALRDAGLFRASVPVHPDSYRRE